MPIHKYNDISPVIVDSVFIASSADIIGDVTIGADSNVWYQCVIRGDVNSIRIGDRVNIQDSTIVHVDNRQRSTEYTGETVIGDDVTIGHKCLIHACDIGDRCFIGMSATVMSNARMEAGSMLAAGALLTERKIIKTGELWAGVPAKFIRMLSNEEVAHLLVSADNYVKLSKSYR